MDAVAQERIAELEAQAEDREVLLDIQAEQIAELEARVRVLTAQLSMIKADRRYVA